MFYRKILVDLTWKDEICLFDNYCLLLYCSLRRIMLVPDIHLLSVQKCFKTWTTLVFLNKSYDRLSSMPKSSFHFTENTFRFPVITKSKSNTTISGNDFQKILSRHNPNL